MGAMADRLGGRTDAVAIWLNPENEMPTMPTVPPCTQSCAATVSTMS